MGALTSLDISHNRLYVEGTKLLAAALKSNQIMTALNISSNNMTFGLVQDIPDINDMSGVAALADAIPDMGAISSVNLLKNNIPMEQAKALTSILKEHPTLKSLCGNSGEETELDMSGKEIGTEGAIMLAPEIAGNEAISSINLLKNRIPFEQAQELVKIMQAKEKLTTLCGLRKDETELDFSNQGLNAGDTVLIANDISNMGALTKLTFGDKQVVTMTTEMTGANFSGKLKSSEAQIVAAFLPKCT
jgi:hypothetical protein